MKYQTAFLLVLACAALAISSCTSFPFRPSPTSSPTSSPTLRCINKTWSYAENIQTRIKIDSDLKITLKHLVYELEVIVITATSPGEIDSTLPPILTSDPAESGFIRSIMTIYGDGRVILVKEKNQVQISQQEKQIEKDQLQKIVSVLEEVNFYAISPTCGGVGIACPCGHTHAISVETKGEVHEINDAGACEVAYFAGFCDLWERITAIIGGF